MELIGTMAEMSIDSNSIRSSFQTFLSSTKAHKWLNWRITKFSINPTRRQTQSYFNLEHKRFGFCFRIIRSKIYEILELSFKAAKPIVVDVIKTIKFIPCNFNQVVWSNSISFRSNIFHCKSIPTRALDATDFDLYSWDWFRICQVCGAWLSTFRINLQSFACLIANYSPRTESFNQSANGMSGESR